MNILVTGGTGFIGTALTARLQAVGHNVSILTRAATDPGQHLFHWQPELGVIDPHALTGVDAVINLAGANIGARRWTRTRKEHLRNSRVAGTKLLVSSIEQASPRPRLLISSSAIGIYGNRGDEPLDENSMTGDGFLAELCRDWENAAMNAASLDVRVVCCRTSLVLSPSGGMLPRLLSIFKYGVGGRLGSGRQYWSWIALDDLVDAMLFSMKETIISGPLNLTAPHSVTNAEFTRILARVIRRPAIMPVPAPLLRIVFGEMADALMLDGQRVLPKRLTESGFTFAYPDLEQSLTHMLAEL